MKPFKIVFRLVAFCAVVGGQQDVLADSYIIVRNYTPFALSVKGGGQIVGPALESGKQFSVSGGKRINPGEYGIIGKVNRDIGIKDGVTYGIGQELEIPGFNKLGQNNPAIMFEVRQKLTGKAVGSDIAINVGPTLDKIPLTEEMKKGIALTSKNPLMRNENPQILEQFAKFLGLPWVTSGGIDFAMPRNKELFNIEARFVGSTRYLGDTKKADAFDDIEVNVNWVFHYDMPKATGPDEINVGFQNLWMRPDWVALGCVATRAPLVANLIAPFGNAAQNTYDVIAFTEAFNQDAKILFNLLQQRGYQYQTGVLGAERVNSSDIAASSSKELKILNGGVALVSKYPITKKSYVLFSDCAQDDCKSWKGAWYAQINKQGRPYHIFAVHTNAYYEEPPTQDTVVARQKQLDQLKKFIDDQGIPKTEPVIIVGDMNINLHNSTEFNDMLRRLNVTHPQLQGYAGKSEVEQDGKFYTFNYKINRLPNDASDYMNLGFLDYALYSNDYLKPIDSFNEMRLYTLDKPYTCSAGVSLQTLQRVFTQPGKKASLEYVNSISDHWFIYGYFKFVPVGQGAK